MFCFSLRVRGVHQRRKRHIQWKNPFAALLNRNLRHTLDGSKRMGLYDSLKAVWKKLGINGQVKNFSSKKLWVIETDSGKPIARWLEPGFKTPNEIDVDGFKRVDKRAIEGHKNWWKIYDVSTAEIYDRGDALRISAITRTAVGEYHFGENLSYLSESWGTPIRLVLDVKRDGKKKIVAYHVSNVGWVDFAMAFEMTCRHEIDNARPVFPASGQPYIRTRRDKELFNNLSTKGTA